MNKLRTKRRKPETELFVSELDKVSAGLASETFEALLPKGNYWVLSKKLRSRKWTP